MGLWQQTAGASNNVIRINPYSFLKAAKSYFIDALLSGDIPHETSVSAIWTGQTATQLGLVGPIQKQDYIDLLENRRPGCAEEAGQKLTPGNRTKLYYDITFDVPKSVSIVRALDCKKVSCVRFKSKKGCNRGAMGNQGKKKGTYNFS